MPHTWQNWSGSVTAAPQQITEPTDEARLIAAIQQAAVSQQQVRVVGSGHSFVPLCASDGLLLSLDGLQGLVDIEAETRQATLWAGSKIHQVGEPLRQAGLAMANMGDIDRQSLAGAISTGTHGTGRTLGNIASQVVGLRLITAAGEVIDCSAEVEPDIFKAAQVSLGALGVITRIRLQLLPAYRLHERSWAIPFEDCMAGLERHITANRHFEFFWSPADDACAAKVLNPTDQPPTEISNAPEPQAPPGTVARYLTDERIGHSHQIFPSERTVLFNESEFAVPAANGPDCMREMRALMRNQYPAVVWPVEYRTLAADDIPLSPAYQRPSVTISVHQAHHLPYQTFFADVEAIFRNHRGRPHWGKIHTHPADELRNLYPKWADFQRIRRRLDPTGLFLNDYLRSILVV